ncbi:hypothetical protein HAX54_033418 [Datura stramonium]|uniref:Peptidase S9 prolyl oligopeptidase catalytic domain-containing protein n=1 Tax=Datura stramonium TaxID=4076 RepID=A0ABS8VDF2_DATST|nr:hypothetical protein [Datura stramonium]
MSLRISKRCKQTLTLTIFASSKSKHAFLCSHLVSLLIVSYRGSLGFGEEAVQSLPGKRRVCKDVVMYLAIDHVIGGQDLQIRPKLLLLAFPMVDFDDTLDEPAPSAEHLALLYDKSPISHVSKVKAPTLMLLGAKDLRVPVTDGLQYARALKEKGVEVKVMMFPDDIHELDRPRTDFESFLNIWSVVKKYCS